MDFDLPKKDTDSGWENQAKRIALVALPFISLYRPAGTFLSVGMGSARAITCINGSISTTIQRERAIQMFQATLAIISVATALFHFGVGSAITTSVDTVQSAAHCYHSFTNGEHKIASIKISS